MANFLVELLVLFFIFILNCVKLLKKAQLMATNIEGTLLIILLTLFSCNFMYSNLFNDMQPVQQINQFYKENNLFSKGKNYYAFPNAFSDHCSKNSSYKHLDNFANSYFLASKVSLNLFLLKNKPNVTLNSPVNLPILFHCTDFGLYGVQFCNSIHFLHSTCLKVSNHFIIPKKETRWDFKYSETRFSYISILKHDMDGAGSSDMAKIKSFILCIFFATLVHKHRQHRFHGVKSIQRKAAIKNALKSWIKLLLIRQKLLKFCSSNIYPLTTGGMYASYRSYTSRHVTHYNFLAKKGKRKLGLRLAWERYDIHLSSVTFLFILLILCGDVHPNPGPVLQPHRRHPQAKSLVTASWNVRTLLEKNRSHVRPTAVVSRELSRYNIDIAALSETRILGENRIDEIGGGYSFFLKGKDLGERHLHGVGFAVRTSLLPLLNEKYPNGINERLMTVDLHLDGCVLTIISAYAPTLCSSNEDKDAFYEQLNEIIREVPAANKLLLLGDFNARVGKDHESWDSVLGHYGVGNENTNGTMLLSLCTRHQLTITNTLFNQEEQFITTWMHPGTKKWHLMDYAITRNRDIHDVLHTRAMCGPCTWSDHKLVKCKMVLKIKKPVHHSKPKTAPKINVAKLRSKEVSQKLAKRLSEANSESSVNDDVETAWSKHKDLTLKIAKATLGSVRRTHKDWFDENNDTIKPLLNELHDLKAQHIRDKDDGVIATSYKACKQTVQASLRAMQNAWWMARAAEVQAAADRRDAKSLYQGLKAVFGPKKSSYPSVKSKNGKSVITDPDKILDRWVEHFDEVLNQPSGFDSSVLNDIPQWETNHKLDEEPTLTEVEISIKQLASGKAAGADGIPPDIYKHGGAAIRKQLLSLYKQCWMEGAIPQDFKDADLVHLYKNKGDSKVCDNHRGISLLSIAGKIYARILLNRLMEHIQAIGLIPESQNGFMPGRSTIDPCFSLRLLQEKCMLHGQDLYLLFIDLTKAFDTVNRSGLWSLLEKIGCPDHFIKMIRAFHDNMKVTVREGNKRAEPFVVTNGTKQGCVLAPTLFSIFFSLMLFIAFKNTSTGIDVIHRFDRGLCQTNNVHFKARTKVTKAKIREFLYADDCALAACSQEDLQELTDHFASAAAKFGLTISLKKTEAIGQSAHKSRIADPHIIINGKPIKSVDNFKYLGSIVSRDCSMEPELSARIAKANSAFNKLDKRLWSKSGIRLETKVMVYRAVVLSCLLYGSEAWTLNAKQIRRLERFHQKCLRSICRIKWYHKIPDFEVLDRCKTSSLQTFLDKNKLRWTGHVIRMDESRTPKILLYGRVDKGGARQGNHLTYLNSVKSLLREYQIDSSTLEEHARNRNAWRSEVFHKTKQGHENYIRDMRDWRRRRKARSNPTGELP